MTILTVATGTCLGILVAVGLIYAAEYVMDKIKEN
jgi:hypothetical protein